MALSYLGNNRLDILSFIVGGNDEKGCHSARI
jgi:hypothetical protein